MSLNLLEWILWSIIMYFFGAFCFNPEIRRRIKILIFGNKKGKK